MSMLAKPRLRVPPGTRLPSASRALSSITSSNTAGSSRPASRPAQSLTTQAAPTSSASALTPSLPSASSSTLVSFPPFLSSASKPATLAVQPRRGFHTTRQRKAKKGAEKRDEINTESTEYSKSGSDAQSAAQTDAAFEPGRNDPDDQIEKAGEGNEHQNNPLSASPANQEFSRPTHEAAVGGSGADKSEKESGQASGGGSPNKAGKPSKG